jgi:trigger factor
MFEGEVKNIQRLVPQELNKEFYDQVFGPDKVKDEKEAKELIRGELAGYYDQQTSNYLDNKIMERVMEDTKINLPEKFLKKWLIQVENKTEDEVNVFFDSFLKDMKWNLINTKLAKQYDVKVEMEDVKERFRDQVKSYFGQTNGGENEYLEQIVDNLMGNKEQVNKAYQEAMVTKTFSSIKENLKTKIKEVSVDEFTELVKKINEQNHKH